MRDISGFGSSCIITASNTFPVGFLLTELADDQDPLDIPTVQIADHAMGVNGDLLVWAKAEPIPVTINVIPASVDDINLSILLNANRPVRGRFNAADVITLTWVYPDGTILTLSPGRMIQGMPGTSIASAGRLKTKQYQFTFLTVIGS